MVPGSISDIFKEFGVSFNIVSEIFSTSTYPPNISEYPIIVGSSYSLKVSSFKNAICFIRNSLESSKSSYVALAHKVVKIILFITCS